MSKEAYIPDSNDFDPGDEKRVTHVEVSDEGAVTTYYDDGSIQGVGPVAYRFEEDEEEEINDAWCARRGGHVNCAYTLDDWPLPVLSVQGFINSLKISPLETPEDYARETVRDYVRSNYGLTIDPDRTVMTYLYLQEPHRYSPCKAEVKHSITLTNALLSNWQGPDSHFEMLPYQPEGIDTRIVNKLDLGLLSPDWHEEQPYLEFIFDFDLVGSLFLNAERRVFVKGYEAVYKVSEPQTYNRRTQLSVSATHFKAFVWQADIQSKYLDYANNFFERHGTQYNLLIKAGLLKAALTQAESGRLSSADKALVLRALGLSPNTKWTDLAFSDFRDAPLTPEVTFHELKIGSYSATDIIAISEPATGKVLLYIPGNTYPIQSFANELEMIKWIVQVCRNPDTRRALEAHFSIADRDVTDFEKVNFLLRGLALYPGPGVPSKAGMRVPLLYISPVKHIHLGASIGPYPFTHFKERLQARLESDAHQEIVTQSDYSWANFSHGLNNAVLVMGVLVLVAPELLPVFAVMSAASIGVAVTDAVTGKTEAARNEGIDHLILGVLNAVPLVGELSEPGAAIEAELSDLHPVDPAPELAEGVINDLASPGLLDIPFEPSPPGVQSLSANMRQSLASLEYSGLPGSGSWHTGEAGKIYQISSAKTGETDSFILMGMKAYQVEWVESAGGYRIVSAADSAIKGPFVKALDADRWDLDFKSGLRGGDSHIEVPPGPEPVPEVVKDHIVLTRAQPPVHIELPMDGIEVRPGIDSWGNPAQRYFALNVPEGTPVNFDADLACWRKNAAELLWLDNSGTWKAGSEDAYLKVSAKLRAGVRSEIYTFPRLPGYPLEQEAIDQTVHQVWVGNQLPNRRLIETIKVNMQTSPELKFTLHIDIDDVATINGVTPQAQLQAQFVDFPNMTIANLSDEPFYHDFLDNDETAEPFRYFRNGPGKNLAAASDVLRYRIIREYGGIYMDCDDVLKTSFSGHELNAGAADVLVGEPLSSATMNLSGPGNSHFASRAGNPVLLEMQKELYTRFTAEHDALLDLSELRSETVGELNPYMAKISEVTGPRLFLEVLEKTRPDYAKILRMRSNVRPGISSQPYAQRFQQVYDFYAPFARRLKIAAGRENSWVPPGA